MILFFQQSAPSRDRDLTQLVGGMLLIQRVSWSRLERAPVCLIHAATFYGGLGILPMAARRLTLGQPIRQRAHKPAGEASAATCRAQECDAVKEVTGTPSLFLPDSRKHELAQRPERHGWRSSLITQPPDRPEPSHSYESDANTSPHASASASCDRTTPAAPTVRELNLVCAAFWKSIDKDVTS